jgi:trk system potassium uptake protein TrkH
LGVVLAIMGFSMFLPMIMGLIDGDRHTLVFGVLGLSGVLGGAGLRRGFRESSAITSRDAYLLVVITWLVSGVYGAIPYVAYDVVPSFPAAFFETVSGFTPTGASVIADVEALERSVLLWRSMTHWLGGLGIVVLFVSLLSFFGNSGMQMFKAESTGPIKEKIAPRIKETAKILWLTYLILTFVMVVVMILVGMTPFDAVCHIFGAVSTGGFSTQNDSLAGYSPLIQVTLAFCTMLSGLSIGLVYTAFKQRSLKPFWENEEFRLYMALLFGAVGLTSLALWRQGQGLAHALTESYVLLTSVFTSTGFVNADYTLWPPIGQFFVLMLPFIGACAGSTAGGMKAGRILILFKGAKATFTRILHPRAVVNLRVNDRLITPEVLASTQSFLFIYVLTVAIATAVFCLAGYDILTSFSVTATCVNNVGPAFGALGPMDNYGNMPAWSMYFMSLLMLLGRLELYTILVLFSRGFWRES